MTIGEHIEKIRTAIYGKEVLNSIADALEQAYTDAEANVSTEVALARGSYPDLGARLDAITKETATLQTGVIGLQSKLIVSATIPETLEDGQICLVYEEDI